MPGSPSSPPYLPTFEGPHEYPGIWPESTSETTKPRSLIGALAGLLGLGAAAALGAIESPAALRLIPSVLLVELGALVLTTPALLALHQFLGLQANVEDLAGALARALVRGGQVAGGLVVVVLSFAVTTDLGIVALLGSLFGVGVFTTVVGCIELATVERRAASSTAAADDPRFTLLLIGWTILSWLIALRIAVHVAQWVMGY